MYQFSGVSSITIFDYKTNYDIIFLYIFITKKNNNLSCDVSKADLK